MKPDIVNHPPHYTSHPSGMECIQLSRLFPFALGNFIKYLWRSGEKDDVQQERRKARWYLDDFIHNTQLLPEDEDGELARTIAWFLRNMDDKFWRPEDEILIAFFGGLLNNIGTIGMFKTFLLRIYESLDQLIEDNENDAPQTTNQ